MKISSTLLSGLIAAGSILHALAAESGPRLVDAAYLASLRSEAVRNHPAARSAALLAAAADRDVSGVRLWDDPFVGLSIMAASTAMRRDDGDIRLSYEQPLPKRGMFAANQSKAEALHRSGVENSRLTSLATGASVARDAIELALADETITLQETQLQWMATMTENARQAALNPDSNSSDALRLQSENTREKQILEAARRTRASLVQGLNLKLGRPIDSPWPALRLPATPLPVPIASSEIARIPTANPKVRALREMAAASASDTRVAEIDRQPQFAIGVDTDIYSGGDVRSASVGLKMSLPFFNRTSYDAKIQAAGLREKAAAQDVEAARLETATAVLTAVADAGNAAAQARAYAGEIENQSLLTTRTIEASWISSRSSLTDLLESRRSLLSVRAEQRRFIAMQQVALEELETLVPRRR